MRIHLKAIGGIIWKVVDEGCVILNEANPTQADNENILANAQAMNVLICALCIREYHRVCKLETTHEMSGKLIEAHEGTSNVKSARLFICNDKFKKFVLLPNEELKDSFSQLNNIVNELKDLGFDVSEVDISHKFLRALPPKYETTVTLFVRSNLKSTTFQNSWVKFLLMISLRNLKKNFMVISMRIRRILWHSRSRYQMMMTMIMIVRLAPMMMLS
jgi:hypothetical protein